MKKESGMMKSRMKRRCALPGSRLDAIVTVSSGSKTYCHDNFGYCARKLLIRFSAFHENVGLPCALIRLSW
jgi:hypothetical protein